MALGTEGLPAGTHIVVDEDGRYRWRATIDLRTNPTMAILIAKIVGGIVGGLLLLGVVMTLLTGGDTERKLVTLGIFLCVCSIVAGVSAIAYLTYAAFVGWSYSADYLLDETGVLYRPAPHEDRVAKGIAAATAVTSLLAGNFGVTAASIAAADTQSASVFSSVRKVRGIRRQCCIKVSQPLLYNQLYVAPEDYDFVYRFVSGHCPKARCVES